MLILGFVLGSPARNREFDSILMGSFQLEICDSVLSFWNLVNDLGTAIWLGQVTTKQWKHWRKLLLTVHKKICCSNFTDLLSQHNGLPYSAVKGWDAGCTVLLWEADSLNCVESCSPPNKPLLWIWVSTNSELLSQQISACH